MIMHEKMPLSTRQIPLTDQEMSVVEDILVDSFVLNEERINSTVKQFCTESKSMKEPKDRVVHMSKCIDKIIDILVNRWGPREKNELYSLASLCVSRTWVLDELERVAKIEMKKAEVLVNKTTNKNG